MPTEQSFPSDNPTYEDRLLSLSNASYLRRSTSGEPLYLVNSASFYSQPDTEQNYTNEPLESLLANLDSRRTQNSSNTQVTETKKTVVSEFTASPERRPNPIIASKPTTPTTTHHDDYLLIDDDFETEEIIKNYLRDASMPQDSDRIATLALVAGILFFFGLVFSLNGLRTNHPKTEAASLTQTHIQTSE